MINKCGNLGIGVPRNPVGNGLSHYHIYYRSEVSMKNNDKRISPNVGKYDKQYWLNYTIHSRHTTGLSRAKKNNCLPLWANRDSIRKIYEQAVLLTDESGVKYEVDHIIPIKGEDVCGLHVENNLQILTKKQNNKKRNLTLN